MLFTPFIKPYPDGYEDFEVGGTPVTASILNNNYDGFLLALNEFLPELEGMVEANPSESATAGNLTKLKVGNSIYLVPSGGGSGDEVSWTQVLGSGTKIGTITINGTPTDVYAPTPIDVEANPSGTATAGDLTKLKVGSNIYSIPSGSGGSGHTILDDDGTALAQEDDLQFVGVYSEDDSTDEVTKVNIYREMTKAQFDLLSADEKKGFIRTTDEPDIYSDGHFQPIIYSTEEREIGVWTDGKPLYEKTIHIDALPSSTYTDTEYAHNISNIEKIVDWEGITSFPNGNSVKFDRGYTQNTFNGNVGFSATIDATNIIIRVGSDRSNMNADFTIRYTKSSDTAGSGSWTPQGVPAVHYSTDEQVIGTWIDGSTLYEKTFIFETEILVDYNNQWTTVTGITLPTGIDVITKAEAVSSDKAYQGGLLAYISSGNLLLQADRNGKTAYVKYLTLQYTKSS